MTPYEVHARKWKDCHRCLLCERRNKVVLCRGKIPAAVLFIGEAPGASEDVLGQPFVGPAGHLLDRIIVQSGMDGTRHCLTNLVCCIPRGDAGSKMGEPPEEAIEACAPRLIEFINLCKPKVVVTVGKLADMYTPESKRWKQVNIVHPASILRADVSQQGLMVQRCVVTLKDVVENL